MNENDSSCNDKTAYQTAYACEKVPVARPTAVFNYIIRCRIRVKTEFAYYSLYKGEVAVIMTIYYICVGIDGFAKSLLSPPLSQKRELRQGKQIF